MTWTVGATQSAVSMLTCSYTISISIRCAVNTNIINILALKLFNRKLFARIFQFFVYIFICPIKDYCKTPNIFGQIADAGMCEDYSKKQAIAVYDQNGCSRWQLIADFIFNEWEMKLIWRRGKSLTSIFATLTSNFEILVGVFQKSHIFCALKVANGILILWLVWKILCLHCLPKLLLFLKRKTRTHTWYMRNMQIITCINWNQNMRAKWILDIWLKRTALLWTRHQIVLVFVLALQMYIQYGMCSQEWNGAGG